MKNNKLWKKILVVILILLMLLIIILVRKFIIINKLIDISKEYNNKTNYIKTSIYVQNDKIIITKSYNKDENFLEQEELYITKINKRYLTTLYKNKNDTLQVIQNDENKEVQTEINGKKGTIWTIYGIYGNLNIKDFIIKLLKTKIITDYIDNKECYLIKLENDALVWVDKDTGLDLRFSNGVGITEIVYEFDTVTDEDIIKPEI